MSRHYGRTELVKILGLLALSVLLLTLPGWAYDFSEAARITNEEIGIPLMPVQEPFQVSLTFTDEDDTMGKLTWDDGEFKFTGNADAAAREFFSRVKAYIDADLQSERDEVAAILERCLEELNRQDPIGDIERELSILKKALSEAQENDLSLSLLWFEEIKRLQEKRGLRRDIEALLGKLRKGE